MSVWKFVVAAVESELLGIAIAEKYFYGIVSIALAAVPSALLLSIGQSALRNAFVLIPGDADEARRRLEQAAEHAIEAACVLTLIVYVLGELSRFDLAGAFPVPTAWEALPFGWVISYLLLSTLFPLGLVAIGLHFLRNRKP